MLNCFAALLVMAGLVASVNAEPPGSPTMIEAGKAVLQKLKRLPPGRTHEYYFEIMRGPDDTVGYAVVSLSAVGKDGNLTYRYVNKGAIRFPTGDRLVNIITARLRLDFEPIEVEMWRARITPDGEQRGSVMQAVIGKDKVTLSTGEAEERTTREVPRPDPPFVYAIEFLAGQVELTQGDRFQLREFDIKSGGARVLEVEVDVWEDGTATLFTNTLDGQNSYQFWFNQSDQLIRWAEGTMPVLFARVGKTRLDQLKTTIGPVERGTKPKGKAVRGDTKPQEP